MLCLLAELLCNIKNENPNILSLLTAPDLTIGLLKFKMAVKKVSALEFRRFIYSYYLSKLLKHV